MSPPAIELRNVWKIFGARASDAFALAKLGELGKEDVLSEFDSVIGVRDVSFTVQPGEIYCVMGLSGSGKSTLLRLINRLHEATSGEVLVHGEDMRAKSTEELRQIRASRMGMVFQNFALMPHRSVRDNVALPLEIQGVGKYKRWDEADRCLELVNLDGWGDKFSQELSGGMQQRVGLARAMAAGPDILLMDEPFSALDPLIRRQLQDEFVALSKRMNITTVFITHDLEEAIKIGHRIAIMKDGEIVQIGTPEEIITEPADSYVAGFVAGISRLRFVHAKTIMQPIDAFQVSGDANLEALPQVSADADLDHLIDVAIERAETLVVYDEQNRQVGVITERDLLQGVQGQMPDLTDAISDTRQTEDSQAPETTASLIADFIGPSAIHYKQRFLEAEKSKGVSLSLNLSAVALGPIWAASRSLWAYFWCFAIAELIAIVQVSRGLWADLGADERARAATISRRAAHRSEQAQEAIDAGMENAEELAESARFLERAAEEASAAADAAVAQGPWLVVLGLLLLLAIKFVEGAVSNWAMERRFARWRSDRSLRGGLNRVGAIFAGLFIPIVYAVTAYRFTATEPVSFLVSFPSEKKLYSAAARALDHAFDVLAAVGEGLFDAITLGIRTLLDSIEIMLVGTPWPVVMTAVILIAWFVAGTRTAIFSAVALGYIALFGFWERSMETVALLGTAAFISTAVAIPTGIWCARSQKAYSAVRPVLDLMQTIPSFVYLIPVIAFFGTGKPPGIIATIIFGAPPAVRLTALGLQQVPQEVREAAVAFGANRRFLLFKVDLPLAMPSIMAGINQTTLMCLAMVVIAALIGAKGLGEDVLEALQYAADGEGVLAGLAILCCAMVLDRLIQGGRRT